jgi:isopentenyl-diphosphate Delta-isomerase
MDKANTPDEILDLVDESDQIIGEIAKREANNNPALLHREVRILIFDSNNRVLIQQRSFKKKVYPGYWALTAGHVPKGMDPEAAAHMEIKEELGFDTAMKFILKRKITDFKETHFAYCYLAKYAGETIIIEPDEVEQVEFFSKAEFLKKFADWATTGVPDDKFESDLCLDFWAGKIGYD